MILNGIFEIFKCHRRITLNSRSKSGGFWCLRELASSEMLSGLLEPGTQCQSCDDEPKLLYLDSILQALEFLQLHFGFLIEEL